MKVEIDVELPEHIAEAWEVVAVRNAKTGDFVPCATLRSGVTVIKMTSETSGPQVILRRKDNPRDWWPQWITADFMTFQADNMVRFGGDSGYSNYFRYETSLIDLSWIPEHLKRSGQTIENPWKGGA